MKFQAKHFISIAVLTMGSFLMASTTYAQSPTNAAFKAPSELTLELVECKEGSPSGTLSWTPLTEADEYHVYTRTETGTFKDFVSTESASINISLEPRAKTVVAVSAVNEEGNILKPQTTESEKSDALIIDTVKLCANVTPTGTINPGSGEKEIVIVRPQTSVAGSESANQTVEGNGIPPLPTEITPTEVDDQVVMEEKLKKLDQKYENSRKTQQKIQQRVQTVISWIKNKIPFFN